MNLNITINGKDYAVQPNQTVLDACRANGIAIPTLCHDPRLVPFGSCMLCRVEIDGQRGTPLACGTTVAAGMIIRTESEAVFEARKTCLELLVSQHYGDCTAPCVLECPAHVDVQGYVNHVAKGEFDKALRLIKANNPLPVVCGRICTRPCEGKCRRNLLEGPVGIAHIKRFAADLDLERDKPYLPECLPASGKRVAIIGAGPAGLSAAWFLAQKGHGVTIFDRQAQPGGMLRYGIPAYRLPRTALDAEIALIQSLGVEMQYGVEFGTDITVNSLKEAGFGAILLAVGSQLGWPLGLDGEESCANVLIGVDFLGNVTRETPPDFMNKRIAVVGGGNTAMDCARTAMRLGASSVELIYRRTVAEMPADQMEIEEAGEEGVIFSVLTNPVSVAQSGDTVQLTLTKMELGEPDASGRRAPRAVAGSEYTEDFDYVISAIGQTQDLGFVNDSDCNVATGRDRLMADPDTAMTNIDGIFATGDAVTGPQTAILAIAGGKRAATAIDQYLRGKAMTAPAVNYNHVRAKNNSEIDPVALGDKAPIEKVKMPILTEAERHHNFNEVERGLTAEQAMQEASRCLSCGCADVHDCKLREHATHYNAEQFAFCGADCESAPHPIDDSHAHIVRDRNKCILCARCVRICAAAGQGVFGFVGRGYDTTVEPPFAVPLGESANCIDCGLCVSTCPTGALVPREGVALPTAAYLDAKDVVTSIEDAVAAVKG